MPGSERSTRCASRGRRCGRDHPANASRPTGHYVSVVAPTRRWPRFPSWEARYRRALRRVDSGRMAFSATLRAPCSRHGSRGRTSVRNGSTTSAVWAGTSSRPATPRPPATSTADSSAGRTNRSRSMEGSPTRRSRTKVPRTAASCRCGAARRSAVLLAPLLHGLLARRRGGEGTGAWWYFARRAPGSPFGQGRRRERSPGRGVRDLRGRDR